MFAFLLFLVGGISPVLGQEAGAQVVFDLRACIQRALEVHPSIEAARADLQIAEAQLSQARAARFLPEFNLTWIVGPSPEARGNVLNGYSDWQDLSVFTRTEVSLVQPLYTFGKLGAAQDAASGGIQARRAGLEKSRQDLEEKVAEAYYTLLLTNELRALADEAREELGKARQRVDEKLEEDTGEYTYTDLFRIDRFMFDVEENAHKVEKGQTMARAALRMLVGIPEEDSLVLAQEGLEPVEVTVLPLEAYLQRADSRPDLQQLQAGIDVRDAQVRAARSDLFPQFFLGGGFKYSYAPNRDNQSNPFVKDDFNFTQLGAVVGLRQSLSFGGTTAKLKQARLEKRKLEYQGRLARKGAELEMERIYRTLREAEANVASAIKARKATRNWFTAARSGFNAGLEPAGELIDAVKEYGIIRGKYYQAVFEFNRAWAALQRATGNSILE